MASSNGGQPNQVPWGSNRPVAGRKTCTHRDHKGSRWLPIVYFPTVGRHPDGRPIRFAGWCKTCTYKHERRRHVANEAVRQQKRDYEREYSRIRRRAEGIPPRFPDLEPEYKPPKVGNSKKLTFLPAAPFLNWLDEWMAKQTEIMKAHNAGGPGRSNGGANCYAATVGDLAKMAGTTDRRFREARATGKIQLAIVDAVLVAADGPDLWELGY